MKTILVPTDFSGFAENALNLSIILARSLEARILLCHVVQLPVGMGEIAYEILAKEKEERKTQAVEKLKALERKIDHAGKISHQSLVLDGELIPELLNCIKSQKVNLVVMGTKGINSLESVILGSCTDQLIQHSNCPVMAVPQSVHFNKGIKRITYATDYHKSDIKDILQLIDIASALKAQVNVLHVSGDDISPEQEVKLMEDFMHKISGKSTYNNLSFQIMHGNKVIDKLKEHISEGSTDVLVTATHHRGLLERIFSKSNTLSLIHDSSVPVIAFHYSAKS